MAKDFLAIMATSAPIEGIFSEFGNIITKNRNSLSDEVAIKTMLLKNWKLPEITVDEDNSEDITDESESEDESDVELFD